MTTEANEADWAQKIGEPAYAAIAEMVAALECDYERLEALKEERESYAPDDGRIVTGTMGEEWATDFPDDAEELAELEAAAGDCTDREDAEHRIQDDPLSIQVRSGWANVGEDMTASEFEILLTTGGPAVRIMGELDDNYEPFHAWLEVQDWGKPWTQYFQAESDTLLTYCRCFTFGQ